MFSLGFFVLVVYLGSEMTTFHYILTCILYIIQLVCYIWVFVSKPGLATVDIIEFEEPLSNEQA